MGIENMRRWPMYIVFALCFFMVLSLFNSWSVETELRNKLADLSTQLQECSKKESACMEESLVMMGRQDNYVAKVNDLTNQKEKLNNNVEEYKNKLSKYESKVNHTLVDVELCKTELQSLKNLQLSKSATLETLRLEKDTLTTQLKERKDKIEELQREIERLKLALTTKSGPSPPVSKVTPVAQLPKASPVENAPINDPGMANENAAKEEMEDSNILNDGNDLEPNLL